MFEINMKIQYFIIGVVLSFNSLSFAGDVSFFLGDPKVLLAVSDQVVQKDFPDSRLVLIQNYARQSWDEGCSQFGWSFRYVASKDGLSKSVVVKFDHKKQTDGNCVYTVRNQLEVEPDQTVELVFINRDKMVIDFEKALRTAQAEVKVPFKVWYAKLLTPLHPLAWDNVFWNFVGPVICDKGAEITIDATTGKIEPRFSTIPTCP